ncbi:MAG: hypothetical protein JJE25_00075 [Bacteroidia bacterium]|nr:hypothetical protein [Bacteroidia bacterium]
MTYKELKSCWYTNFLFQCKANNIVLRDFLSRTNIVKSNASNYFNGKLCPGPRLLHTFCICNGIQIKDVFVPYINNLGN